jgi:putative membrane protein
MLKNVLGGILVGAANIIPGVSGGTILVILNLFDKLMESISNLFKKNISLKERLENFKFIFQVGIGLIIGLVLFAKILEFLFTNFSNQTLCLFAGIILFSIPMVKKQELKGNINWIYFIIGILIIGLLVFFSPEKTDTVVSLDELLSKTINIQYIFILIIIGMIGGATMLFPGVSGSMVLLILGYYYLYTSYVSNVTSFEIKVLIPLIFIAIGVILGIIISAKITTYLLKKYSNQTVSLILGLIFMSGICIIPLTGYNASSLVISIICFIVGALFITLFDNIKK